MSKKQKKTTDAVTLLHRRYIKGDPARLASIEAEREKIKIAEQVYAMRKERGLTQQQLADLMGTTQSVISRLESTDYESERIDTLQKLAAALHCHLELRFVPEEKMTSVQ
ncbi:MAG: helix-turn-helix domain-containing protein [Phycisphaerae bacterium]|nr:helix-turn-helix domain-containing protein [Phycisphaerae bacterium]